MALEIAYASTYPPRRCGIATFTRDLAAATGDRLIVALQPPDGPAAYPSEVRHIIRRDHRDDYLRVAAALNRSDVRVVSVQHEYGIWGGDDGEAVLDFVAALRIPVVTTLHTVPVGPTVGQRRVLTRLVEASSVAVVMSKAAAGLLGRTYGVDPHAIDVVAHGVPDLPLVDSNLAKPRLRMAPGPMILSFGLLGPGKGYEAVIEAMPAVVRACPTAYYAVLGATHPELLRREGEAYRTKLTQLAEDLGVSDHVIFVNRFVTRNELGSWLTAADIFVTPYPNRDQIVSGTLSYAMSAGKACVSTPYAYAVEMLEAGRGRLVEFGAPAAIAHALTELVGDDDLRKLIGRKAYDFSRTMIWPAIGAKYRRIFDRVAGVELLTSRTHRSLELGAVARAR
jgi:glycosyltransferase involved in cell wall biosynthesis